MKKNYLLIWTTITTIAITLLMVSCDDEEKKTSDDEKQNVISENITANTTWKTGETYVLAGRVAVTNGATLTIEPGVVVKGEAGTGSNATALIIAQGAKIDAQGTEDSPIIFTTVADEIEPGDIVSPNLDPEMNGLWGGLIILGKAPISVKGDGTTYQIEGIPASDVNGLYGGSDAADNSGILKYVSIRHGGANIGEGNEINGLTLGGVGSGTTIENIEVVANQDDGIEFFGGTVTVKNVVVWNAGDDALDTDQGFAGTIDNAVVINPFDECFEIDGPEGTPLGDGTQKHTFKNVSVYAESAEGLVDLDNDDEKPTANSNVIITNVYFTDVQLGQDFDDMPTSSVLSNMEITFDSSLSLSDFFKKGSDAYATKVNEGANTVGATKTAFANWSWTASASGKF